MESKKLSESITLYAVRSQDGKYYKSRGQSGIGPRWVTELSKAKIYTSIGSARGICSWWYGNYPQYGMPGIVTIESTNVVFEVEEERLEKFIEVNSYYKQKHEQYAEDSLHN